MAKNKRKQISGKDSNAEPQKRGAESVDRNEELNGLKPDIQQEGLLTSSLESDNPESSDKTDSAAKQGSSDVDLMDDLLRSMQKEERAQQTGKYSGKWWSRGKQTSQPVDGSDEQVSNISTPETPAGNMDEDDVAQEKDFHQSGKYSGKWWSRSLKSIRYEEPAEGQASNTADEEAPAPTRSTQSSDIQDRREDEKGFLKDLAKKYASVGTHGAGYRHEDDSIHGSQGEAIKRNLELEELKKKAFRGRILSEEEDMPEIRSIVLDGEEAAFVEVQSLPRNTLGTRFSALENVLRPFKMLIFTGLAILLLIMAIVAGWLAFNIFQRLQAPEVVQEGVTLPYPVVLSLPGGLNFELEKGTLEDGEWNPQSPQWLEGTDLCRWIAIPWSPQLEAVIQTLQSDDLIQLEMSNNDRVKYKVTSIQQVDSDKLHELDSNTPCLVLVLAGADSKTRWVVTAMP